MRGRASTEQIQGRPLIVLPGHEMPAGGGPIGDKKNTEIRNGGGT